MYSVDAYRWDMTSAVSAWFLPEKFEIVERDGEWQSSL